MDQSIETRLNGNCHPTIWLRRTHTSSSASKLGGLPWLPDGVAWPRQLKSNTPLHFLAQIDLAALPPSPLVPSGPQLPSSGILYFFADMYETMMWGDGECGKPNDTRYSTRVVYAAIPGEASSAMPAALPPQVGHVWGKDGGGRRSSGMRIFPEAPLEAYIVDTFVGCRSINPDAYSIAATERTFACIERVTGGEAPVVTVPPYQQAGLTQSFFRTKGQDHSGRSFGSGHFVAHQMLGPPTGPHGFKDNVGLGDDVSLFQIASDTGLSDQFSFSQGGPAHFWVKRLDLAAGHFDRAYGTTA